MGGAFQASCFFQQRDGAAQDDGHGGEQGHRLPAMSGAAPARLLKAPRLIENM